MNCNCGNEEVVVRHVRGNTLTLAIPLQERIRRMVDDEETVETVDYNPLPTDVVTVNLRGFTRTVTFVGTDVTITGNVVEVTDKGTIGVGTYGVEILIDSADGKKRRYYSASEIQVVEQTKDAGIDEGTEYDVTTRTLEAAVFDIMRGYSAYEIWLQQGHEGTEADFLEWLTMRSRMEELIAQVYADLENYWQKSETYNRTEIDARAFKVRVVAELPTSGISTTTIYLLREGSDDGNLYAEYLYVGGRWERIGGQDWRKKVLTTTLPTLTTQYGAVTIATGAWTAMTLNLSSMKEEGVMGEWDMVVKSVYRPTISVYAPSGDEYVELNRPPEFPADGMLLVHGVAYRDATGKTTTYISYTCKMATVAYTGSYNDLEDKPTIPVLSELARVATSGLWSDLTGRPMKGVYAYTELDSLKEEGLYGIERADGDSVNYRTKYPTELLLVTFGRFKGGVDVMNVVTQTLICYDGHIRQRKWNRNAWGAWVDVLSMVAYSGSYNDLNDKPTIPDTSTFVPTSRKVNGKALTDDIVLDANDVGALPASTPIPGISGKADKVASATNGHLAGLNASGNLTDSGIVPSTLVYQGAEIGSTPSVDFDAEADTVHVTAQTLSAAQKQQVRENIGAAGVNDVAGIPIVNHRTSDTGTSSAPYSIAPNMLHVWGEVGALYLSLTTGEVGYVQEYMIQFTSGSTATTLSLPNTLKWLNGVTPSDIEASKTYQVSIMNGVGVIGGAE